MTIMHENDTILDILLHNMKYKRKEEYLMDDGGNPTTGILVFVGLIIVDFVIFGFGAAMQNLSDKAVEKMAKDEKSAPIDLLSRYMDKSERYTHLCQLLVLMAHMLLGVVCVPVWRSYFTLEMNNTFVLRALDVIVFAILMLIVIILGVYTPEKVAARKPESWAVRLVRPMRVLEIIFTPVIWLADMGSNLLARVFGVDPLSDTDDVTEEEIISMVDEGHEQGMLLASEAEMIHNIFEFGDKEAKDIMTHRKNIVAIDGNRTFRETLEFIKENNYSRFPVYIDDIDNVIGVLHIKEALDLSLDSTVHDKALKDIEDIILEVDFIPETRNINSLFASMQSDKSHMVIVVDEYGQTAGIVAMEDILEEIVGNIEDEHDEEEETIEKRLDGSYYMSGMASFEEVMEELEIEREEDEDEFETLNGFLISLIGKIPSDDEVFSTTAYGYLFEILAVENKMIQNVHVVKLPEDAETSEGEEILQDTCENS